MAAKMAAKLTKPHFDEKKGEYIDQVSLLIYLRIKITHIRI